MTIKTFLIAVALVVGFFTFLSVTWDVSIWLLQDPSAVAEKQPKKVQPAQKTEGNAASQGSQSEEAKSDTIEIQDDNAATTGTYDDSWSGNEPIKSEIDPIKTPTVEAPAVQKPNNVKSLNVPFPSDDRENVEPEIELGTTGSSNEYGDPYQPDERETN